jgi:hypothetical protein
MFKMMVQLTVMAIGLLLIVPTGLAHAQEPEGPGYGGNADNLSVTWTPASSVAVSAMAAGSGSRASVPSENSGDSGSNPDILRAGAPAEEKLTISGLGFGTRSEVAISVGDGEDMAVRADTTGTLRLDLDSGQAARTEPGVSVLAMGRTPSGSSRTLVGAVPPKPNGIGPSELLPWLIGAVLAMGLGVWAIRRRAGH